MSGKARAVFLDRDGVLNDVLTARGEPQSPRGMGEFSIRLDAAGPLKAFRGMGFLNIVVTNQPDIARGYLEQGDMERMHAALRAALPIDDIFFCPHDDADGCACRKPKPGMLLAAAEKWGIELTRSYMIGDTARDIGAGENAGCVTILLRTPYNRAGSVFARKEIKDLEEFSRWLRDEDSIR